MVSPYFVISRSSQESVRAPISDVSGRVVGRSPTLTTRLSISADELLGQGQEL